jgi:hypothetical protein
MSSVYTVKIFNTMKIRMTVEIDLASSLINHENDDERMWVENEILVGTRELMIHSEEVGDFIGEVTKVSNLSWLNPTKAKIQSPLIGSVVKYMGGDKDDKKYPCDVIIVNGTFLDPKYNRVSNWWTWKAINKDGSLSEKYFGYGNFEKSDKEYEVTTLVKQLNSKT